MNRHDHLLVVRGLTTLQQQEFLDEIECEPLKSDEIPADVTALGEIGTPLLIFAATAGLLAGICRWLDQQTAKIDIEVELFKVLRIKISKGETPQDVEKKLKQEDATLISDDV